MANLKTQNISEDLLKILIEVQKLKKDKRYKDCEDFPVIETHLSSAQKLIHKLLIEEKIGNHVRIE